MNKIILSILLLLFCNTITNAQMQFSKNPFNENYHAYVKIAVEHYSKKEYNLAAENYSKAFVANGSAALSDRIKLAACWSMAGFKDSAFKELKKIEPARYSKVNELCLNKDFNPLHADPRWNEVISFTKANRAKYNPQLNIPLTETLDTVLQNDQKYRLMEQDVKEMYGDNSIELKALYKTINYYDSVNLKKVLTIIDKNGWPSSGTVGDEGATAMFLVIQHADLKTQENYLSYIKKAVEQRSIPRSYLAMLEDRIAISHGRKQIYGTQIGTNKNGTNYLEPLEDPDNVDKRRAEVGLGSLTDYLKQWDIEWPVKNK